MSHTSKPADENADAAKDLLSRALEKIETSPTQTEPEGSRDSPVKPLAPGDPCPQCAGHLVLRASERGEFLGCSNYPSCNFVRHLPAAALSTIVILPTPCPQCGLPLAVKRGRFGIFIGCSDYPSCRYRVQEQQPTALKCPQCGKGELVKRQARSGRIFYGCTNYPSCDFVIPGEPMSKICTVCGFPLHYKKKIKAGIALYCANPLCPTRHQRCHEIISPL